MTRFPRILNIENAEFFPAGPDDSDDDESEAEPDASEKTTDTPSPAAPPDGMPAGR